MKNVIVRSLLILAVYTLAFNTSYSQYSQSESDRDMIYKEFEISQNDPNPFLEVTNINFEILIPGNVSINIYDADGRMVETLVDGEMESGKYNVYFKSLEGMIPGEYYYKLEAKSSTEIKKMSLYGY